LESDIEIGIMSTKKGKEFNCNSKFALNLHLT